MLQELSCLIVVSSHKIQEYRSFFTAKVTEICQGSFNTLATLSFDQAKKRQKKNENQMRSALMKKSLLYKTSFEKR